ncbi:MAG: hypothetical protein GTO45_16345 [Candidatus Aminicenantes bacterium]|nr:hypothetical protein [Candidatus Aminicenantes bacterium]NIM78272.1 hypothetical protein [Candidatus Aminicenantes bacterium]NIN19697.1 hypothetical protein [Candidatus Aminicenantes bacterium]NIN43579.1 hypothetical protein [Candidatus Aminicenantes bacterium]NIN86324.1 hypothetical protein [Candidatus Aminicenantes bacterium]
MKSRERKNNGLGKGMELIRDGIELTGKIKGGRRCVCSPGGWSMGNQLGGCACGCFGPSSAEDNNKANFGIANPEV